MKKIHRGIVVVALTGLALASALAWNPSDASARLKLYDPLKSTGGCIIGIPIDTPDGVKCGIIIG